MAKESASDSNYINGNLYPWYIKVLREFGFPVAIALILMGGFGFVGNWMINNQTRLIDSTIMTNSSLTKANDTNMQTLQQMRDTMKESSAVVLQAVHENNKVINSHYEITKANQKLNEKQIEILEGVTTTHRLQTEQLQQVTDIMQAASTTMEPVPAMREESLKKQDQTNQKLDELIQATKNP